MPERERPLRIALLTHSVNPRGGVVHCLELAQALHAAGHEVTLMAPAAPGQTFFRRVDCAVELAPVTVKPANLAQMVGSRIEAYVAHLGKLLQHRQFDILHAHDGIGGNALADLEDHGLIDGHVRTVHHIDDFADPQVAGWQERALRRARRVFCVSRLWCEILRDQHGIDAAQVSNGVDTRRYTPHAHPGDAVLSRRLGLEGEGPVFLAVGGIEERKNTLRILLAFCELWREMPEARLVIAGGASLLDHDDYRREFIHTAQAHGLADAAGQPQAPLILTGPVPDADMPGLFRLADALLMPSLREGFGLVVLEAMASGTPAVVSRMAPFTEYLREAEAFWADPQNVHAIADAMRQACRPSLARSLALAAAPAVCARYSWEASARTHVDLYRALLAQPAYA
jgi:glycosyltransferase-like protein